MANNNTVILAEKPSVAEEIARIKGALVKREGYYEGKDVIVTWSYGHLLKLTCKEDGSPWRAETLPLLPVQFYLAPRTRRNNEGKEVEDTKVTSQLEVIRKLFLSANEIIAATDAGREGQLIFEYIYAFVGATAPVRRLWISSLTEEAIREGLDNLYDNKDFYNLYLSAACRAQADWLVGINATRALTIAAGGQIVLSMGRVQTPALCMISRRYIDMMTFEANPYWTVRAVLYKGVKTFKVRSSKKFHYASDGDRLKTQTKSQGYLTVKSFRKEINQRNPPRLYSTAKIQEEASSRYGMTASTTKDILQSLYARHKVLTYPRTDTRYIPEDVFRTIPTLLDAIASWHSHDEELALVDKENLNRTSVNQLKITDHHALIPTGKRPDYSTMTADETKIFTMILERFIEAFCPASETENTSLVLENKDGYTFEAKGKRLVKAGWRGIRGEEPASEEEDEYDNQPLPELKESEEVRIIRCENIEGSTKAPSLYTDGTMVHAMKYAGRNVEDETMKKTLRDIGLGTADTRDAEIDTLVERGYIVRDEEGHLVPTKTGLALYMTLKDQDIANVGMTGKWEVDLMAIADGTGDGNAFNSSIRKYVKENIVDEIFQPKLRGQLTAALEKTRVTCPYCGQKMENRRGSVTCSCGFRVNRMIAGKSIDEFLIEEIIENGETQVIRGFIDTKGRKFSARLYRGHDKQVHFKRDETKKPTKK